MRVATATTACRAISPYAADGFDMRAEEAGISISCTGAVDGRRARAKYFRQMPLNTYPGTADAPPAFT